MSAKSVGLAPAIAIWETASGAFPVLDRVATNADDVVPTVVLGKAREGVSVTAGAAACVPVPDNCTVEMLELKGNSV